MGRRLGEAPSAHNHQHGGFCPDAGGGVLRTAASPKRGHVVLGSGESREAIHRASTKMSDPGSTIRHVGSVIDFEAWRSGRRLEIRDLPGSGEDASLQRLERAIRRLDVLIARGTGRLSSRVESELLAITAAVTAGRTDEAVERAERLTERLEHPSARAQ